MDKMPEEEKSPDQIENIESERAFLEKMQTYFMEMLRNREGIIEAWGWMLGFEGIVGVDDPTINNLNKVYESFWEYFKDKAGFQITEIQDFVDFFSEEGNEKALTLYSLPKAKMAAHAYHVILGGKNFYMPLEDTVQDAQLFSTKDDLVLITSHSYIRHDEVNGGELINDPVTGSQPIEIPSIYFKALEKTKKGVKNFQVPASLLVDFIQANLILRSFQKVCGEELVNIVEQISMYENSKESDLENEQKLSKLKYRKTALMKNMQFVIATYMTKKSAVGFDSSVIIKLKNNIDNFPDNIKGHIKTFSIVSDTMAPMAGVNAVLAGIVNSAISTANNLVRKNMFELHFVKILGTEPKTMLKKIYKLFNKLGIES